MGIMITKKDHRFTHGRNVGYRYGEDNAAVTIYSNLEEAIATHEATLSRMDEDDINREFVKGLIAGYKERLQERDE